MLDIMNYAENITVEWENSYLKDKMAGEEENEQLRFRLIEEVQKHPVIFDKSHLNHYKTNMTNDVWAEIHLILGVKGNSIGNNKKVTWYF